MSDTAAANGRKRNTESNSTAKDSSTSAGDNKAKENKPPPLSWKLKICYGLGHVWNDLCASLWFTYLLLFMKFALGFDENSAGVLMLIGQVADAIATPLAGLQVDKKYSTFTCWKYGHRKTWHLIGTVGVLISFPFIFENCLMQECAKIVIEADTNVTLPTTPFVPEFLVSSSDAEEASTVELPTRVASNSSTYTNFTTFMRELPKANLTLVPLNVSELSGSKQNESLVNRTVVEHKTIVLPSGVTAAKTAYYALFITIFQFGWAAVQIAHLSLIPCLTHCQHQRTELNAIRYGFTVLSNIAVYSIAWVVLGMAEQSSGRISAADTGSFRNISLISTVIGVVFTVFFHIGVSEDPLPVKSTSLPPSSSSAELTSASTEDVSNTGRVVRRIKFYEWFKTREFYEVAMIYQATRLFCNLSQVYITLYLQETLSLGHQSVAVIPLVMFLGGFGATFFLKKLNKKAGRKVVYGIGFLLGVLSAIWIWIGGTRTSYKEVEVYFVSILLGASGTVLLVTSMSMQADLIGPNSANGGFIYGAMSFADKMTNGIAIMLIQYLNPCQNVSDCLTSPYPGTILVIGCGGSATLGMIFVMFMKEHDHEAGVFKMPKATPENQDQKAVVSADNPAFMLEDGAQNLNAAQVAGQTDPAANNAGSNRANNSDRQSPTWTNHQLQPPSPDAIYVISQDTNEIKI